MKKIFNIFLYLFLAISQISLFFGFEKAWYLSYDFEPKDKFINEIPISQIDPSWTSALVLKKKSIPKIEIDDFEKYAEPSGATFQAEGDFNKDGRAERAVIGVYETNWGTYGRFFLILTRGKDYDWEKEFLYKVPGKPGFSVLWTSGDQIYWSFCYGCDNFRKIIWKSGQYELE